MQVLAPVVNVFSPAEQQGITTHLRFSTWELPERYLEEGLYNNNDTLIKGCFEISIKHLSNRTVSPL